MPFSPLYQGRDVPLHAARLKGRVALEKSLKKPSFFAEILPKSSPSLILEKIQNFVQVSEDLAKKLKPFH